MRLETPYVPETLGYDSSRLEILHNFFQVQIDKKVLRGGTYALTRNGKLFAAGAVGRRTFREDDERPLRPDSIFRIASITKFFTATAVFKLVEDGLCRLDEPMKNHIPEMDTEDFACVTIAQVLSHTGGIPVDDGVYQNTDKPSAWELIDKEFKTGGHDFITAGLSRGRESQPGTRWEYSSFGYVLLGELIGRLSGMSAGHFIEQYILIPCGMGDSGFWSTVIKRPDFAERLAYYRESLENSLKNPETDTGPWAAVPETAGGLFSTVTDLVKFGNMLLNGGSLNGRRVLGRKAIEKMSAEYTTENVRDYCWSWGVPDSYRPYGLGPDLTRGEKFPFDSPGTFFHEGAGKCRLSVDPAERFVSAYYVPYIDSTIWNAVPIFNTQAIICSGLM